ncbi:MAG: glutamate-5-semialdehyde dehydrogenase, partial [Kiritimatiellae bacterium]|nr:glutamate-5-semialdehyde dehydrogenase [Kiritimatiellia bacterium]
DRLTLTPARFDAMVAGVRHVASLPDPVGETIWTRARPSGISIRKVRVPLGVVAVVFESRPNVFVDTAALCLKTGNAVILRGGKEALETNKALAASVRTVLARDEVQLVETTDHAAVTELVRAVGLVDVAIPRGGERLIRAMCEAALVPVLKHYKGVCHVYVDDKADFGMALSILDNAKTQRPGVCNAAECLLVHERIAPLFLPMVEAWARDKGVTLHADEAGTEYLSLDLNVATVADCRAAIEFVNAHSSHHSDCIVTNDAARAAEFLRDVDSACVYHNVSTRFTDGAEFGMGAEIGISTDKLHARGPMGLEELTTYKYVVTGDGVIRR